MVERKFKFFKDVDGWMMETLDTGTVLPVPPVVLESFTGREMTPDRILPLVDCASIALSGVTNSLNIVEQTYFEENSVLKYFFLKSNLDTIDADIAGIRLESIDDYEQYHIIDMGRDVPGNDDTIHAYIKTPKDDVLRCVFDNDIRLFAKRNNVSFWVDDYRVDVGSNGGKFVRPINGSVPYALRGTQHKRPN